MKLYSVWEERRAAERKFSIAIRRLNCPSSTKLKTVQIANLWPLQKVYEGERG